MGGKNSQPDYASHMERERIVRERTSCVKEVNGKKEIEGVIKQGGTVEISVHKVQTEQSEEQVRVGEKDEGKTGGCSVS